MMSNVCGFSHLRFTRIILDHTSHPATDFYTDLEVILVLTNVIA